MRRSKRFILSIDPPWLAPVINRYPISYLRETGSAGWCAKCSRAVFEWSQIVRMILIIQEFGRCTYLARRFYGVSVCLWGCG